MKALECIVLIMPILIAVGSAHFLLIYRPWDPRKHTLAGRHLQMFAAAVFMVFGLESVVTVLYVLDLLPDYGPLAMVIEIAAYSFMTFVVWHRVYLFRRHQRDAAPSRLDI